MNAKYLQIGEGLSDVDPVRVFLCLVKNCSDLRCISVRQPSSPSKSVL